MNKKDRKPSKYAKSDFLGAFYISLAVFVLGALIAGIIIVNVVRF